MTTPGDGASGPLRLLILNWRDHAHPHAGGAEVYAEAVARRWAALGHRVEFFSAAVAGAPDTEELDGVRFVRRGNRLSVYREARRYVRSARTPPDAIVDAVNTRPFLAPRFAGGVPVVALFHQLAADVWHYEAPRPVALAGRYVLEPRWLRVYRDVPVVAVSPSTAASLAERGLRRVTLVGEAADIPAEPPGVNRDEAPTLVYLGRMAANKRPDHAVAIFEAVREKLPDARLWLIGDGPLRPELEARRTPGVRFFGRVSEREKYQLLARAHVLLATSVREGWGINVSEAASVGTPAVGYDVAGLRDSVPASAGVLVPAGDVAAAAAAAVELVDGVRSGAVRAHPGGIESWETIAERILRVVQDAVVDSGGTDPEPAVAGRGLRRFSDATAAVAASTRNRIGRSRFGP